MSIRTRLKIFSLHRNDLFSPRLEIGTKRQSGVANNDSDDRMSLETVLSSDSDSGINPAKKPRLSGWYVMNVENSFRSLEDRGIENLAIAIILHKPFLNT